MMKTPESNGCTLALPKNPGQSHPVCACRLPLARQGTVYANPSTIFLSAPIQGGARHLDKCGQSGMGRGGGSNSEHRLGADGNLNNFES